MPRRMWTREEDELVRQLYPSTPTQDVANRLGRTVKTVYQRAKALDIYKDAQYMRELNQRQGAELSKHPNSLASRLKPGNVPHTKGKAMPPEVRAKVAHTWFPKGNLPHNTAEGNGAISIRRDSKTGRPYAHIRISLRKWVHLHRHVWEQHAGPVPKGMVVWHRDGNTMNNDIRNLMLLTQAEVMRINTIHNLPEELKSTISAVAQVKRRITLNQKDNGTK